MSCSIRFESEQSIEEKRKIRQSEWEKVRKPEDPLTAPEVPVCNKSLFEQLQVILFCSFFNRTRPLSQIIYDIFWQTKNEFKRAYAQFFRRAERSLFAKGHVKMISFFSRP